jgi:tRNA uridine 5-carboxymethylaminomethyl modification enzyme
MNAGLGALGKDAWHPRRDEAYIGVLVDDLITLGTKEPYRMFTSRAEYRLILREDNADLRLTEKGRELGLVSDARWAAFSEKRESIERETQRLRSTWVQPGTEGGDAVNKIVSNPISREYSLMDILKRPEVNYSQIANVKGEGVQNETVAEQVEIAAKYEGYILRQQEEIDQLRRYENTALPVELDYSKIGGLSNEIIQKLSKTRPETLGVASRISGVTPAAVSQLLIHLKKHHSLQKQSA